MGAAREPIIAYLSNIYIPLEDIPLETSWYLMVMSCIFSRKYKHVRPGRCLE